MDALEMLEDEHDDLRALFANILKADDADARHCSSRSNATFACTMS
jgi:hypothetical protein